MITQVVVSNLVDLPSSEALRLENIRLRQMLKQLLPKMRKNNVDCTYIHELRALLGTAPEVLASGERLKGDQEKTKTVLGIAYAHAHAKLNGNGLNVNGWSSLESQLIMHFSQLIQHYHMY